MPTILIADDSENILESLTRILEKRGYKLLFAQTAAEVKHQLADNQTELVLLDLIFPDCNDLSLLRHIKAASPATSVIMLSSNTEDLRPVVEAIHAGADDWIPKPPDRQNILVRVEKVLRDQADRQAQQFYLRERQEAAGLHRLIGESEAMKRVRNTIQNLADSDCCVLIQGESGTGKELAARALHNLSIRKSQPFIAINCAAIPETLSNPSSLAMRRAHLPAPTRQEKVLLKRLLAEPSSSMRSARCHWDSRRRCCACLRARNSVMSVQATKRNSRRG